MMDLEGKEIIASDSLMKQITVILIVSKKKWLEHEVAKSFFREHFCSLNSQGHY